MEIPFNILVGVLAEICEIHENQVRSMLNKNKIYSWEDFIEFLNVFHFHHRE